MAQRAIDTMVDKKIMDDLRRMVNTESDDIWEIFKIAGATPAGFEEFISKRQRQGDGIYEMRLLNAYMSRVGKLVDAAIADDRYDRSFINREKQINVFYNYIFFSKKELIYHG